MNLRLDRLLQDLRSREAELLAAIDADPLLIRRQSGPLTIANAGALLFTPQAEHQLFAKGIVYRRDPFRLVSLPLIKIYNLGEKDVSVADLAGIAEEPGARLRFLRKFDGSMIQRFQFEGRVYFTTRGTIEGGPIGGSSEEGETIGSKQFDFLGTARRLAMSRYPILCQARPEFEGLTLIFELLHPDARVITDYRGLQDLILLACFDRSAYRYRPYAEVEKLARAHGLNCVHELSPTGQALGEQIESLLAAIAGTDQEGMVIAIESPREVIYRIKVKSPDYLRVLKLMVACTYAKTAEILDAHPEWTGWTDLERHLQGLGSESVPEEVLGFYREHYEAHAAYLADCERLRIWASGRAAELLASVRDELTEGVEKRFVRKAFAARALQLPLAALLFAAFDGRLSLPAVRQFARTPAEAREALTKIA